jgi:hypothetical protein
MTIFASKCPVTWIDGRGLKTIFSGQLGPYIIHSRRQRKGTSLNINKTAGAQNAGKFIRMYQFSKSSTIYSILYMYEQINNDFAVKANFCQPEPNAMAFGMGAK